MKRPLALLLLLAAAAVGLTACGQSSQDKAKSQVCDARSDISKNVNELKGLTLTTATVDGVKQNVKAIQDDLGKIKDAQGNLNADRKKQVQAANEAFTQQVKSIASSVGQSLSLTDAGTQLKTAASQLATSYQQTLGKIDCS
jgi:Tfp pilus assembly protein PilP